MQSGRIAPIFRQFFQGKSSAKSATDSHSQQKQQPDQGPEREPTREEALEALDVLTQEEDFQKSALKADLSQIDGKFCITVMNASGAQLKVIRGPEILRLLDGKTGKGSRNAHLGRILDRRV